MVVYIVTKEGAYRHDILGVYDDLMKAMQRALECIMGDNGINEVVKWTID